MAQVIVTIRSAMAAALVLVLAAGGLTGQQQDTLATAGGATTSAEAQSEERVRERAERERQGGGLRMGAFQARGLAEIQGAVTSATPVFEGYFQRGLDKHLALESSIGFWRRTQWRESDGGFLGAGDREQVTSYLVPLLTSVKLYPFTAPGSGVEPYLTGGVGFALGIDDKENTTGGFLGVGGRDGTAFFTGFGFKAGVGLDLSLGGAFGLGGGARYQWTRFGSEVGGNRTYQGLAVDGGLVYRFQF